MKKILLTILFTIILFSCSIYESNPSGEEIESSFENLGLTGGRINQITSMNEYIVIATTNNSIYYSTNNANSWNKTELTDRNVIKDIELRDYNQIIYITTYNVFAYNISAKYLEIINNGLPANSERLAILCTEDYNYLSISGKGIYRANRSDNNWEYMALDSESIMALEEIGSMIFVLTEDGVVLSSSNNGVTWIEENNGLASNSYTTQIASDEENICCMNQNGDLFVFDKSNSVWVFRGCFNYGGLITKNLITENNVIYISTNDNLYYMSQLSSSFERVDTGINNYVSDMIIKDNYIFLATQGNGILTSIIAGNLWQEKNNNLTKVRVECSVVTDEYILAANDYGGLYKKDFNSNSWEYCSLGGKEIDNILITNNNEILVSDGDDVYISSDLNTWEVYNSYTNMDYINTITQDEYGTIFCGTYNGLYKLNSSKDLWNKIDLPYSSNLIIDINFDSENNIYIADYYEGVYKSDQSLENWTNLSNGISSENIKTFIITSQDNLIIGTTNTGIYKYDSSNNKWISVNSGLLQQTPYPYDIIETNNDIYLAVSSNDYNLYKSEYEGEYWSSVTFQQERSYQIISLSSYGDDIYLNTSYNGIMKLKKK